MKVAIVGSRTVTNLKAIEAAVKASKFKVTEVVCGMAKGADLLGKTWAEQNSIPVKEFPAQWDDLEAEGAIIKQGPYGRYNSRAGYDRNKRMAEYAEAVIACWDGKSKGTEMMLEIAEKLGLKIYVYYC